MKRLKFLDRWLLLLALASLLTSCLPRQVDLAATPSLQKTLTPVSTSTSTSEPTLIPSGTPTATLTPTALSLATPTLTPTLPPFTALVADGARARLNRGGIRYMVLSPDSQTIAIGTTNTLCMYRAADISETWCNLAENSPLSKIESLAYDPLGKSLATGLANGDIIFWDAASGLQQFVIHSLSLVKDTSSLAWSPDGSRLASTADNEYVRIWDAHTGNELDAFKAGDQPVNNVRWSPDGKLVAAVDELSQVFMWDAQSGKTLWSAPESQGNPIFSLVWSPDSSLVAASGGITSYGAYKCADAGVDGNACAGVPVPGGYITVWNARSGQKLRQFDTGVLVNTVAFNPDGTQLLAGLEDHVIRFYQLADGTLLQTLPDTDANRGAAWLPGRMRLLATTSQDTLVFWNLESAARSEVPLDVFAQLSGMFWSPEGTRLATSSTRGTIFIWGAATGELLRKIEEKGLQIYKIAWSPDGKQIAATSSRGVLIWDAATGKLQQVLEAAGEHPYDLSWSPDSRYFASVALVSGITLWDAQRWRVLKTFTRPWELWALAWSPDGKTLAIAGVHVILWDAISGQQTADLGRYEFVTNITWTPDGSKILASSWVMAEAIDIKTGEGSRIKPESTGIAAFSPDGQLLAYTNFRGTVLQDASGRILKGHADLISQLAISSDGKTVASCSYDGTVILWDIPPSSTLLSPSGPTVNTLTPLATQTK